MIKFSLSSLFLFLCDYFVKFKQNRLIKVLDKICANLNYKQQSTQIDGTNIRNSNQVDYELQTGMPKYLSCYSENCRTMYDILSSGANRTVDQKCLGTINRDDKIEWINYQTVLQRAKYFADGLLEIGHKPKSFVGIYAKNCAEYTIYEYACYRHSMMVVPIYESAHFDLCIYISNHVKLNTIVCDSLNRVEDFIENSTEFESLKNIILIRNDNFAEVLFNNLSDKAKLRGFTMHLNQDIEQLGKLNFNEDNPPSVDDTALIHYTSGTSGCPKGAILSHQNVVANFSALMSNLSDYAINESDTLISYLPLGHILGRICEACQLAAGGKIVYFRGEIKNLNQDIQIAKPTIFPCVPRVLNKVYDRIHENVHKSTIKSWLLKAAYYYKRKQLSNQRYYTECIWDLLVFSKIRNQLGGNVRVIPVTSAPMDAKVLDFLRCAIGCPILQGYGLTECAGACTTNLLGDFSLDQVGAPLDSCSIKLIDVPEMNYYATDGKGELMLKGSIVFKGYYLDNDKTDETIDQDGWLHTGDIGQWNENGTLQIIDRKKDIFKLSHGEYIAPEKIEQIYSRSQYVQQMFVYGDSLKSCLVAIVVPKPEISETFKLQNNSSLKLKILEDFKMIGKSENLNSIEQIKNVYIHCQEFSIENGLLTPTLKNKRFALKEFFLDQLNDLYKNNF